MGSSKAAAWVRLFIFALFSLELLWSAVPDKFAQSHPVSLPVLHSVAEVRQLSFDEARRGYPAHIRAVVTYFDPIAPNLFVEDKTGGIWVHWAPGMPALKAGQELDLQAKTTQTDFAPDLVNPRWTLLGNASLPEPRSVSFEQMSSTSEDARWVGVEGIVRWAGFQHRHPDERVLRMRVAVAGGTIVVQTPWDGRPVPSNLVDSKVKVTGVCGAAFTPKQQLVGVIISTPSLSQVEIVEEAKQDPYEAGTTPIADLGRYNFHESRGHRKKLRGMVLADLPSKGFYMADGTASIYVESPLAGTLQPGDRVEALGFLGSFESRLRLEDAVFRKVGAGPNPEAAAVTAEQVMTGEHESELVSLEGRMVSHSILPTEELFLIDSGRMVFSASLRLNGQQTAPKFQDGSVVRITGVCVGEDDIIGRVLSFKIVLRSASDLRIIHQPAWWTMDRALTLLGILGAIIAAILVWEDCSAAGS